MIKLATVFSGIGAIEQAFIQKGLEKEIIFACDNGDIEIDVNYEKELKKIREMKNIKEKKEYVENLYKSKSKKTNFVKISYNANYKVKNDNFFYDVKLLDGTDFKDKVDLFVGRKSMPKFFYSRR